MKFITLAVACIAFTAAEDATKVRELDLKGMKFQVPRGSRAVEPLTYTSKDDLAKSPVVGNAADAIAKQVDFAKEKVAVFAWAGSGQDKVAPGDVKDKIALFIYTRGRTRDLRMHVKAFAVPKEVEVKVAVPK